MSEDNVIQFPSKKVNFQDFGRAMMQGNVEEAGRVLSKLLNISEELGQSSAKHFAGLAQEDPSVFQKTMQIRFKIMEGQNNEALLLIQECFNLTGPDSLVAMEAMKDIIADA